MSSHSSSSTSNSSDNIITIVPPAISEHDQKRLQQQDQELLESSTRYDVINTDDVDDDDLNTPLLLKEVPKNNDYHNIVTTNNNEDFMMELERSHDNLHLLNIHQHNKVDQHDKVEARTTIIGGVRGEVKLNKQKTLTWDKDTSHLKVQWLDHCNDNSNNENNIDGNEIPSTRRWSDSSSVPNGEENNNEHIIDNSMNTSIATVFLRDYESGRPCSLSPNFDTITPLQVEMYNLRFSTSHQFLVCVAIFTLFLASFFEGQSVHGMLGITIQMLFTAFSAFIFTMDIVIRGFYDDDNLFTTNIQTLYTRKTRARRWKAPMLIMLFAVTLESAIKILVKKHTLIVWSSVFKPVVFFYVSSKARDALYALMKVTKIVFKVIVIELFLILSFSAMACHLYFDFEDFKDLSSSFLSLFELSTTAVTPTLWISVYNDQRYSAFFFVTFLIICVFYMHSLVLSIVFQIYIQAMKLIRERSSADRQEALNLAFLALRNKDGANGEDANIVDTRDIRKAFTLLRPHYNDAKINVLVQIVDPTSRGNVDFNTFRIQIPKAIQTSLRSARQSTRNSLLLESLAFCIAVANVVYVLVLSSALEFLMLANAIIPIGTVIVLLALCEVTCRIRPFPSLQDLSTSRHVFLDGLAIFSGILSLCGLIVHTFDKDRGLQPLLLGRAIDMIRLLRFSSIFRSIIDRTTDVLPALVGPIVLVISSLHIYTYTGMALWQGSIIIGKAQSVLPLYDLNNFNEYSSGLLTMFNIFVVNNWQEIANVYLFAEKFNSPYIVYLFFISANLLGVSILLNVLTAFFVGTFVTKVESNATSDQNDKSTSLKLRMSSRQITTSTEFTLNTTSQNIESNHNDSGGLTGFHVFERQGYDSVMKTITGDEDDIVFAKKACELLKVFEKLMPPTDKTGYLMCCQRTKDCYGNRHFIPMTRGYIEEDKVLGVIDEMFAQLLNTDDDIVQRDFPPLLFDDMYHQHLLLSASICENSPPVAMFVASMKWISAVV